MISGRAGVALIMDGNQFASIHSTRPEETVPRKAEEFHYLIGEGRDFFTIENVTRDEIVQRLLLAEDEEDALRLALILQDPAKSERMRRRAASALEELLSEGVGDFVEGVFYAKPIPDGLDVRGGMEIARAVDASEVEIFLQLFWTHRDAIRVVREAWSAIPADLFNGQQDRWQATLVRGAVFRDLARSHAESGRVNDVFVAIRMRPSIKALPNDREIMQKWMGGFLQRAEVSAPVPQLPQVAMVGEDVHPYGKPEKSQKSFDRNAALEKVQADKEKIRDALRRRDNRRVDLLLSGLLDYQRRHGGNAYTIKTLCDLAKTAKDLGRIDLQIAWTAKATELVEDDGWAWRQYADALHQANRLSEAAEAYRRSLQYDHDVVAMNGLAEILRSQGRLEDALAAYREVREQHPHDVVARNGYAVMLTLLDRAEDALETLGQEEPRSLYEWSGLHIRGMVHLRGGDLEQAIEILQRGAKDCPWSVQVDYFRTALAIAHLRKKDANAAVKDLSEVKSEELRTPVRLVLVHARGEQEEYEKAEAAFQEIPENVTGAAQKLREEFRQRYVVRQGKRLSDQQVYKLEESLIFERAA